ncbi:MAG: ParA family protein [Sandaracinaceae bacterium]|nr:ParA family protein [Sandaracinaceae bacterium]
MMAFSMLSQKGGVGKTTVALNLALAMAERGFRTCLIDLDPQGGIGLSLRRSARPGSGITGLLRGDRFEKAIQTTRQNGLVLLMTGDFQAEEIDAIYREWSSIDVVKKVLSSLKNTDVAIFDVPAGLSGPGKAAALVTKRVLIPLQSEPLALRTIPAVLRAVGGWKNGEEGVSVLGLLLTMTSFQDETSLSVLEEVWSLYPEIALETHIPRDAVFARASALGVPVAFLGRKRPPVASVFERLAAEIEGRLGLGSKEEEDAPRYLLD